MPYYEVSARTTLVTATANAPLAALRSSTTRPAFIKEIHIFSITAPTTSGALGLCRSTALGTGTLTSVSPAVRQLSAAAAGAVLVTNWATLAPTNGGAGAMFRRWDQPASFGNGVIWTWDGEEDLEMALGNTATGELCICNLQATAPGTFDITVIFRE